MTFAAIGLIGVHGSQSSPSNQLPAHPDTNKRSAATVIAQLPAASAQDVETVAATPVPAHSLHAAQPPTIHAACAILMDAASGQVLYERNADTPRPMASTTKIMTALLFCEHVPDNAVVVASPAACAVKESSLHLKVGEKLSAHDLLRAILMRSANDACVDAAEHVAGSEDAFVQMMNDRATALGCTHTHFTNPHGLNDADHYTTARDLALIARAAIQEPRISEVVRTRQTRIKRSIDQRDVTLYNHSHFLGHYLGADGIKTGWTVPAGHCYVGSATQHNWRLISVVLKSPDYVHETAELMHYGFTNYEPHVLARAGDPAGECPLVGATRPTVPAVVKSKVQVVLRRGDTISVQPQIQYFDPPLPVESGATIGLYKATVDGRVICAVPLLAATRVDRAPVTLARGHKAGRPNPLIMMGSIFGICLVSLRYGSKRYKSRFAALTKSARRRGRRLAKSLRGDDYAR
jgi:serine-type D-Ala-D-Ala carboxypeptidase (penicillin-binding protein 5/6)